MALKLSNNASGLLAFAISGSATSLTLEAGHGSRFPALGSGDWFPITVVRASNPSQFEIMRCTGRSGDTLTVVRGQEGTSAITFSAGSVVELRLTSGTLEENFPQVEGRNAKNLRFSIDSVGGKPELKFKSGDNEETVLRRSDVTTSPTDTTPGRLLKVGDGGILARPSGGGSFDFDDPDQPNQIAQFLRSNATGSIPPTGNGTVLRQAYRAGFGSRWYSDLYISNADSSGRVFSRAVGHDGTEITEDTGWREHYHTGNIDKLISDASLVQTSRTISTGTGLTGGGNLSANRTISLASSHYPIGVGQSWKSVTRYVDTTYTNTTQRPIMICALKRSNGTASLYVDGVLAGRSTATDVALSLYAIVPPGSTYRTEGADTIVVSILD